MGDNETHWGRILHIAPGGLGRSRIMLEIHERDLAPFECWVTTRIPKGHESRVGDDVSCAGVRIHWGRPPQYGDTPSAMPDRAEKVYIAR